MWRWRRVFALLVLSIALGFTISNLWRVSTDAAGSIARLATANPESSQWALAQAEVEVLKLQNAISQARAGQDVELAEVRRRFDILYARLQLIKTGEIFATVRETATVATAIRESVAALDGLIPIIDADDATLQAALDEIDNTTSDLAQALRFVSVEGIRKFSETSVQRRADLSSVLSELTVFLIALGALIFFVLAALIWQLVRLQRTQTEIATTESRLRTVIETALDAVVVIGPKGRILEMNHTAIKMFGRDAEEAQGRPFASLFVGHRIMEKSGDPPLFDMEGLVQREAVDSKGRRFPAEVSISRAKSGDGFIYVAFLRDISDRIAAEQEIVTARDKALAGERAKADLLAVMSHEMRTPVNGIMGGLEVFGETDLDEHQNKLLAAMQTSASLLLRHVNAGLDIARIDAGAAAMVEEEFVLLDLLDVAIASLEAQAAARGNVLRVVPLTDELGLCLGDPGCLLQVLINLVGNAIKFTRDGEITIEAERQPKSDIVELRIIDTGKGIAEDDLERIFEEFVMVDPSYDRDVEGTGLGLPIVKRLVTAMSGQMGVESDLDAGSVFWVRLPLRSLNGARSEKIRNKATGTVLPGQGKSVLLVEDNEINRLVANEMLTALGFRVVEAVNGKIGVTLAQEAKYDAILMDISMPVLNGVDATTAIRAAPGPNQDSLIIGLTAHASPNDIARFVAAGMACVVVKPASKADLAQAILGQGKIAQSDSVGHKTRVPELEDVLGPDVATEVTFRARQEILSKLDDILSRDIPPDQIVDVLHQMIGLSSVVGLNALSKDLRTAKAEAEARDLSTLRDSLRQLRIRLQSNNQGVQT